MHQPHIALLWGIILFRLLGHYVLSYSSDDRRGHLVSTSYITDTVTFSPVSSEKQCSDVVVTRQPCVIKQLE